MQTGQIVQLWVKFAINLDVKTTLKMFVAGFLSSEGDPNHEVKSKLMNLDRIDKAPLQCQVQANS